MLSCFIKIQIGLTFLVPAYRDVLEKKAIKWAFVFTSTHSVSILLQPDKNLCCTHISNQQAAVSWSVKYTTCRHNTAIRPRHGTQLRCHLTHLCFFDGAFCFSCLLFASLTAAAAAVSVSSSNPSSWFVSVDIDGRLRFIWRRRSCQTTITQILSTVTGWAQCNNLRSFGLWSSTY